MAVAIAVLVGLIVGAVLMYIIMMIHGHSVLVEASEMYKGLIDRGDAAIALLANFQREIDNMTSGAGGKRILKASSLDALKTLGATARATTSGITVVSR